jgi:fucose 4-O-acetylase-like acetyltransferase
MGRDFGVNIVTIPQVFALFVYGVKNPTRHEGMIQRLGRDCSMMVYILHPAVWHTFEGVYGKLGISVNLAALYVMPILVLAFSVLFSLLFNVVMAKVTERRLATK